MEQVTTIISDQRGRAYNEAVDLVEMTGDQALIERFVESSALLSDKERSLKSLIKKRLCGIYGRRGKEAPLIETAEAIVTERANGEYARVLEMPVPTEVEANFDWVTALRLYRECYAKMKDAFGLPGDWFTNDGRIIRDPGKSRLLGNTPEMT